MLFLVVLAVNFVGDGLRDAIDPQAATLVDRARPEVTDPLLVRSSDLRVEFATDDGTVSAVNGVSLHGRDAARRSRSSASRARARACTALAVMGLVDEARRASPAASIALDGDGARSAARERRTASCAAATWRWSSRIRCRR